MYTAYLKLSFINLLMLIVNRFTTLHNFYHFFDSPYFPNSTNCLASIYPFV